MSGQEEFARRYAKVASRYEALLAEIARLSKQDYPFVKLLGDEDAKMALGQRYREAHRELARINDWLRADAEEAAP